MTKACGAVYDRWGNDGMLPARIRYVCILEEGHKGAHAGALVFESERRYAEWDELGADDA